MINLLKTKFRFGKLSIIICKPALLLILTSLFFNFNTRAQEKPFAKVSDLSKNYYQKQKDSLKKSWVCATLYKEKKTQNKYAEIYDSRTSFLIDAIQGNNFLHDKELMGYVNAVVKQLVLANKSLISSQPLLLIDRNESVNAYAVGGNVIAVNVGLLSYIKTREELALILAHELAHNVLMHSENAMKEKAELLTSEEYINSLEEIRKSKFGRLSQLKEVLKNYSFSRSRHGRYKESEADSLAIVMLGNAKISFDPGYFLRLDSSDAEYKQPLKNPVKSYFQNLNVQLDDQLFLKKSKGLSSKNYNFSKGEDLLDSLKTHPDCKERYDATKKFTTSNPSFTPVPASVTDIANKLLVWNLYSQLNLTQTLYRIFLIKDAGNIDPWYDVMLYNVMAGLQYSDKKLARFNSIGVVPKELTSKDYYSTQTMMEQISTEQLSDVIKKMGSASIWSDASTESKGFKGFLSALLAAQQLDKKTENKIAKDFISNYPSSIYVEVAEKF